MKPRRTLRASISVMAEQGHNPAALAIRTEHLDAGAEAWLAERCEVLHIGVDDDRFPKAAKDAQALIVRTYTTVDERLLERMPRLRVVGRAGTTSDFHALGLRLHAALPPRPCASSRFCACPPVR